MNDVTITPTDNGPYLIQGGVTLVDGDGNPYQVDDTIALCRCRPLEHKAVLRREPRTRRLRGGEQGSHRSGGRFIQLASSLARGSLLLQLGVLGR